MNLTHIAIEAGFAAVLILAVWILRRLVRRHDFAAGRQAFRDGLRFNVKWNEDVKRGWIAEKLDGLPPIEAIIVDPPYSIERRRK